VEEPNSLGEEWGIYGKKRGTHRNLKKREKYSNATIIRRRPARRTKYIGHGSPENRKKEAEVELIKGKV